MLAEAAPGVAPQVYLPLIVLACSIVQSLMGVGLLLFGTPTLLLLGMGFGETLAVLLPCSVTVNLCQLHGGMPRDREVIFRIVRVTLPMVFAGSVVALMGMSTHWMPLVVGFALLAMGGLRLSLRAINWLNRLVAGYEKAYLATMGLVHGLSNMGGGLLVVYAGAKCDDKDEIRRTIALCYLGFALTQLATLGFNQPGLFRAEFLYLPVVSLLAFLTGNRLFRHLNALQFARLVTGLILTYGAVTVSKAIG